MCLYAVIRSKIGKVNNQNFVNITFGKLREKLEYLCELFISYAYQMLSVYKKSESIYRDLIENTEATANINIMLLAKYFMAALKTEKGETEGGMLIINDSLAFIRDNAPQESLICALFKKLLIETAKTQNLTFIDVETEQQKLLRLAPNGELTKLGI